ncbi:MAG: FecR domain-containing protein [bacterium]|nr:FecR domain-containing protein [bacterium]
MKWLSKDIIFLVVMLSIVGTASARLYLDSQQRIGHKKTDAIGTITFKKKTAKRKYSEQVVWETVPQNSPLYNYDSIRTGDDSVAVVHLKDGTEIELDENTLIMLSLAAKKTDIDFTMGAIAARKEQTAGDTASTLSIASKGTTVEIEKGDINLSKKGTEALGLNVSSGSASVVTKQGKQRVAEHEKALISKGTSRVEKESFVPIAPEPNRYYIIPRGKKKIRFSWKRSGKGKRFNAVFVDISKKRSFSSKTASIRVRGTSLTRSFPAGAYYWRLRGRIKGKKKQEISSAHKFTIVGDKPAGLTLPAGRARLSYFKKKPMIRFKWKKARYTSSYELEIAKDPAFKKKVKTIKSSSLSIATDTLGAGRYFWRIVSVYRLSGKRLTLASGSRRIRITQKKKLDPPRLIFPVKNEKKSSLLVKSGQAVFNWNADPEIARYEFQVSRDPSFKKLAAAERSSRNYIALSKPLPNGKYYWRVVGITGDKTRTAPSGPRKFTVVQFEKISLNQPISGAVIDSASGKIRFSWRDPNGGKNYLLRVYSDKKLTKSAAAVKTKKQQGRAALSGTGTFFWKVQLRDKRNTVIAESNTGSFNIAGALPGPKIYAPKNRAIVDVTYRDKLTFSWKPVPGASHYTIAIYQFAGAYNKLIYTGETKASKYIFSRFELLDTSNFFWELQAIRRSRGGTVSRSKKTKYYFSIAIKNILTKPELSSTVIYDKK